MNELVDSPGLEYTEKKPWRWPTVLFAALPATYLAIPTGLAILVGFLLLLTMKPTGFPMFIGGVLGWVGMISLWVAARSSGVVTKWTARGLAGGIVGYLIFFGFRIFQKDLVPSKWSFMFALTIGPLLFSFSYLLRYWQHAQTAVLEQGGDPLIIEAQTAGGSQTRQTAARPFNEARMRRILLKLLIISAILELIYFPSVLKDRESLNFFVSLASMFPFILGIVLTTAWCFWRSRALRGLAVVTLLTSILLPCVLSIMSNLLGLGLTASIARYTAVAIPILIVLFMPKQIAGYMPQAVVDGRGFNICWIWLQSALLLLWGILAILLPVVYASDIKNNWFLSLLVGNIGASIVVALISLALAYIGLRAQKRRRTSLRITQIVLSILLLLIAVSVRLGIMFLMVLSASG